MRVRGPKKTHYSHHYSHSANSVRRIVVNNPLRNSSLNKVYLDTHGNWYVCLCMVCWHAHEQFKEQCAMKCWPTFSKKQLKLSIRKNVPDISRQCSTHSQLSFGITRIYIMVCSEHNSRANTYSVLDIVLLSLNLLEIFRKNGP